MLQFHFSRPCAGVPCARLAGRTLCFLDSRRCTGSGPVPTPSVGSAVLGPDAVSCGGIAFRFAAMLKVWCLKHFPGKWGTKVQPPPLPGRTAAFISHLPTPRRARAILDQCAFFFFLLELSCWEESNSQFLCNSFLHFTLIIHQLKYRETQTRHVDVPPLFHALTVQMQSHHPRLHSAGDAHPDSPGATSLWKASCLHSVFLNFF